jgi:hypothetical protein
MVFQACQGVVIGFPSVLGPFISLTMRFDPLLPSLVLLFRVIMISLQCTTHTLHTSYRGFHVTTAIRTMEVPLSHSTRLSAGGASESSRPRLREQLGKFPSRPTVALLETPMHCFLRHLPSASSSLRTARLQSRFAHLRSLGPCSAHIHIPRTARRVPQVRLNSTLPPSVPEQKTWIDRLPPKVRPYLYLTRIDKPIGTLLLFYPCSQSTWVSFLVHMSNQMCFLEQLGQSPWRLTLYTFHFQHLSPISACVESEPWS